MKRLVCFLLTVVMLCGMIPVAANVLDTELPFNDVKQNHWWYDAIAYCYENNLLKGMSENEFGPAVTLTRAMFVQALANFEGISAEDLRDEVSPFTDVKESHWFYVAVEWARQNGIVGGMTETTFAPNGALTRAQMARLFCQYAKFKGLNTVTSADVFTFEDAAKIPGWALEGMTYCVGVKLFVGSDNKLTPSSTATRAQLATVITKFHQLPCNHLWDMWSVIAKPTEDEAGVQKRVCSLCGETETGDYNGYDGRIVCWGDSLTQGILTGFLDVMEVPYPERMSELLGVEVINYGIGGEAAYQIASRQGGMPIYAFASEDEPFVIPTEGPTDICLYNSVIDLQYSESNYIGEPDYDLYTGINPVTIDGVVGEVKQVEGDHWTFTRLEPGEEKVYTEHVPVQTFGMTDKREDDIVVIWIGHNDSIEVVDVEAQDEIVDYIDAMIKYADTEKFLVLGLISERYVPDYAETNRKIQEHLESIGAGDKFLDVRSYLADIQHLIDLGIKPTERDIEWLEKGWIPESLFAEKIDVQGYSLHLNRDGYDILAAHVADKIVDLGYFN